MNRLLPAILLALTPALAHGATYYVAKTGSDSNSCAQARLESTPKLTIKAGLACLSGGDTVVIKAGIYSEVIEINTIPSGVDDSHHTIVKAATGEQVIVNGSGTGLLLIYSRSFITIDGIVFDGSNITGHGVYLGRGSTSDTPSTFVKMQNCTVRNAKHSGVYVGHNQDGAINCSISIINVKIHNSGNNGGTSLDHGLYSSCQNVTIDGGEYYDNPGHGIHVFAHDAREGTSGTVVKNVRAYRNGSWGIGLYNGSNLMAYNNLLYGNGVVVPGSGGLTARFKAANAKIYNNTSYKNIGKGVWITGNPATIRNNIVYLNSSTAISDEASPASTISHNLTTTPSFDDADNANFQLKFGSPATDAGMTINEVTCDFLGVLRPKGTNYDIGAFEYTAEAPPSNLRFIGAD